MSYLANWSIRLFSPPLPHTPPHHQQHGSPAMPRAAAAAATVAGLVLVLVVMAALPPTAAGRKFDVYPSCFSGNTSMPHWAKENVKRCRRIFETTVDQDNIIHSSVKGGEWQFFHFAMDDFEAVNRAGGSKVRIEAAPCHGSIQLFVKPGLNFNGEPMNQMFETMPNSSGTRTSTWPFPDNHTGVYAQGPEEHMVEKGWAYPGPMFREMVWGNNASGYGVANLVTMKILHGSYYISVLGTDFRNDPKKGHLHNNFTLSVSMIPNQDSALEAKQKVRAVFCC